VGANATLDQVNIGQTWYFTPEMTQAVQNDDAATIQSIKDANIADLKANMDLIAKKSGDAFVTVTNKSDGQEYKLCASDNGWIWAYTLDLGHDNASPGKLKATVSCGTFTKSKMVLGISVNTISSLGASISQVIINTMLSISLGKFISQRVGGALFSAALERAEAAAAQGIEGFASFFPKWIATGSSFLGGMIGGAVIAIVLLYLINYFYMSFGLEINVYNWSLAEEWDIVDWHSDNALMQSPPFAVGNLPAASSEPAFIIQSTVR
jgi:hypothetical protein